MRAKCTHLLLLTAWLLATGSQWDVVQVAAWSRMFANYARVLPARDALELTFSPSGKCEICRLVDGARQDQGDENGAAPSLMAKEPLVFLTGPTIVVPAPAVAARIESPLVVCVHERAAPPIPPPRAVV